VGLALVFCAVVHCQRCEARLSQPCLSAHNFARMPVSQAAHKSAHTVLLHDGHSSACPAHVVSAPLLVCSLFSKPCTLSHVNTQC
jgi:hypothetical protein